jgi:hypothetical protein
MKNKNKQDIASTLYRKVREKQLEDFKSRMHKTNRAWSLPITA